MRLPSSNLAFIWDYGEDLLTPVYSWRVLSWSHLQRVLWHECMQTSTGSSNKLKISIFLAAVLGSLQPAYRTTGKRRKNKMVCSYRKSLKGVDEFEDRSWCYSCHDWNVRQESWAVFVGRGVCRVKAQGVQLANLSCFPQWWEEGGDLSLGVQPSPLAVICAVLL